MYNKKSIEDIGEGFRGKRVLVPLLCAGGQILIE